MSSKQKQPLRTAESSGVFEQRILQERDAPWVVLLVDGDRDLHRRLRRRTAEEKIEHRSLHIIGCVSAHEARESLATRRDIALALINCALETETAGLDLVTHIRQASNNRYTRLALFTSGGDLAAQAPRALRGEINDFRPRAALLDHRLAIILHGQLQSYHDILELKNYRDRYNRLANADGLTGIPNRRHFDKTLDQEWRRARRRRQPLASIMIDIDFFKDYNDRYGHLAGDDALKRIAQALHRALRRPGDSVARFGGEEFICLLPDTDLRGACQVAKELHQAVDRLRLPHQDSTVSEHLSISLGVAVTTPKEGKKPADLIKHADAALYQAKEGGRNRIEPAAECSAE